MHKIFKWELYYHKGKIGKEKMISTFSKNFAKLKQNFSTTDKELLGIEKEIFIFITF